MAISTPVQVGRDSTLGHHRLRIFDITLGSSYPTGGEPVTLDQLRLTSFVSFVAVAPTGGRTFEFDHANLKIKAYNPVTAHTHTENTAVSYTQNATTSAATAGAGSQVANATDLSAVTVRCIVVGT